jgi:tripartite-type tricarboxylate transporter receptor subunit TctC
MKKGTAEFFTICLAGAILLALGGGALAQEKFPARPVTVIVHTAPGGGSTVNAQSVQRQFEKAIGGSMMIVNKPGGGGTIAWNFVANAPADGYTVLAVNPSLIVTRYTTQTGVSYERFEPLIMTVLVPAGVVVRADSPWKTLKDFIDHAKANPGKVQMGNSGHAAMFHVGIVGMEMALGLKFTHVPFKGTGPVVTALLGGHVDAGLNEISSLIPYVEARKLRILAVSSAQRSSALPDVPTFKENGFDLDVGTWYGYMVPQKTPKERVRLLQNALKTAADSDEFKALWKKQGGILDTMGPERFASFLGDQDKLWKKIIDFGGFKPDKVD